MQNLMKSEVVKLQWIKIGREMMMNYLLTAVLFLFVSSAWAQNKVIATVDTNEVQLGETLTLTISAQTSDSANIGSPRLPSLEGFDVVNTFEGVESRSTFVNGSFQFQRTQKFNFVLSPNKKGTLNIDPVEVVVGDKTYKTSPISVRVTDGSGGRAKPKPRAQVEEEDIDPFADPNDLFNMLLRRRGLGIPGGGGGFRTQPINPDEAFFIQLEVDKTNVYEGEQITASWYLYTPYQVRDIDTLKYPSLNGFWKEDIEIATRLNFQTEVLNGKAYNKALLVSYAIFPLKAGKATIDPYKARCTIVTQNNLLGFGQPMQYTKASQQVPIEVKAIPKDGMPSDYSGGVGEFKISASMVGGSRFQVNQPFSVKVKVEGRGNAKPIELPALNLPTDLELYDTKSESKFFKDGSSYKEFEIFIIPRRGGNFTFPAISFSSFSPEQGRFVTSQTSAMEFSVGGSGASESLPGAPMAAQSKSSKPVIKVMEPVLSYTSLTSWNENIWNMIWSVYFISIFGALYWKARNELGWAAKAKSVIQKLSDRVKDMSRLLAAGDYRGVGRAGSNLITIVLGELTQQSETEGGVNRLIEALPPSVKSELGASLLKINTYFETLAFAPEQLAAAEGQKDKMKSNAKELEDVLKRVIQQTQIK